MVCMSVPTLVTGTEEEINNMLSFTQSWINQIRGLTSQKLSLFFVFTKCDLISGFVEFTESFSKKELDNTFGISMKLKGLPEEQFNAEITGHFQNFMTNLWMNRISSLRVTKRKIDLFRYFAFPLNFSMLDERTLAIIKTANIPQLSQRQILLLGIYFTGIFLKREGAEISVCFAKDLVKLLI